MKQHFQLSRLDGALLVAYLLSFGACLVLMVFRGANGPLVLLTVGAALAAVGKLGSACHRAHPSTSAAKAPEASDTSHL